MNSYCFSCMEIFSAWKRELSNCNPTLFTVMKRWWWWWCRNIYSDGICKRDMHDPLMVHKISSIVYVLRWGADGVGGGYRWYKGVRKSGLVHICAAGISRVTSWQSLTLQLSSGRRGSVSSAPPSSATPRWEDNAVSLRGQGAKIVENTERIWSDMTHDDFLRNRSEFSATQRSFRSKFTANSRRFCRLPTGWYLLVLLITFLIFTHFHRLGQHPLRPPSGNGSL